MYVFSLFDMDIQLHWTSHLHLFLVIIAYMLIFNTCPREAFEHKIKYSNKGKKIYE